MREGTNQLIILFAPATSPDAERLTKRQRLLARQATFCIFQGVSAIG